MSKASKFNDKQLLAIELLARKEYEDLTIEDIYTQVGCSRATIFNWMKDEDIKRAISKRSLELIQELSPMLYKTTAELLQSKDQRCQAKGVDVFLKATERADQLRKEEEASKEVEIDIESFIEELDIYPSLKKCRHDYKRYYNQWVARTKESITVELTRYVMYLKALELLSEGVHGEAVEKQIESFDITCNDVAAVNEKVLKFIATQLKLKIDILK